MNGKLFIATIICVIFFLLGAFQASGQEKNIELKDKIITIQMEKQHLAEVLKYLMESYDISFGFEQSDLDSNHSDYTFQPNLPNLGGRKFLSNSEKIVISVKAKDIFIAKKHWITINAENKRLEDILNIIVKQMKNYSWEIKDGVVNIFPIKGRNERFEKIMRTKIKKFSLEKDSTVEMITAEIIKLPEFKEFLSENKFIFTGERYGDESILEAQYCRKLEFDLNFSNITFQNLLNKIAKAKKGGWLIKLSGFSHANQGETIDLDI